MGRSGKGWAKKVKRSILGISFLSLLLLMGVLVLLAEQKISRLVVGGLGESFTTTLYSAPFLISFDPHSSWILPTKDDLIRRLKRLSYKVVSPEPKSPGEFSWVSPHLDIYLRNISTPELSQPAQLVHLVFSSDDKAEITDMQGRVISEISIEPEILSELSGPTKIRREPATWEEIPSALKNAVVAVEDEHFFKHWGLNPKSILRAVWNNVRHHPIQGGSTITQQLVKNLFLNSNRTVSRKLAEAFLAVYLEFRFSKEKILTLYLNHIYFGQDGGFSVAGVKSAAEFYFGKKLPDLTLAESALLAGLIRSPYRYNPFRNPQEAIKRKNFVLGRMKKGGLLDESERVKAVHAPLKLAPTTNLRLGHNENEYFVSEVVRELLPSYGEDALFRFGYKIFTTMDPLLQKAAAEASKLTRYQVGLVALDPRTGQVLALIGGKEFKESQFNRATQAHRQPGSAFKPFIYGSALEKNFTAASLLDDTQHVFKSSTGQKWNPKNFDGKYEGPVPLRRALAHSLNAATLDLAQKLGVDNVIEFAHRMGIHSLLEDSLAIALGTSEVTLLELTGAYAPFANGGFQIRPTLVSAVQDSDGQVLEINQKEKTPVLDSKLAFVMASLLQSVIQEGTAKRLSDLGWTHPSAGKTGTTNEGKDAWFIGFTPQLLAGVWVGDDEAKPINVAGAAHALPLWAAFMKKSYKGKTVLDFEEPQGIVRVKVDPLSGLLPVSGCPSKEEEIFVEETQPTEPCPLHSAGIKGFFQKMFRKK